MNDCKINSQNTCDYDNNVDSILIDEITKGSYLESFLQNGLKTNQLEVNTDSKTFKTFAKLKEPRELFALPKELDCPQQAARWPTECQVVETRIRHITWSPSIPEPYYIKSGKELQPQPVGEEAGTVVFQYYPMSAVNYFSRSTVGGSRLYLSACATTNVDDELIFESRFESGNLAKAIKITSSYYELYLRTDLYTNRHTQWFYFRINNTRKQQTYRFSIVNLSKPESLYNEGMRPLLYSTKDSQLHSIGWRRCGQNITHYKNDPTCEEEEQFPTYTLTFNIEFPHSDDTVYLAHCYPYTYSDLQEYLSRLQAHPVKSTFTKLRLLCRTLAGNNVYYLTITSPNESETKKKRAIVISARVHPGETPSSWMMKGFMDYLTGDSSQAKELREKFIFKLIPMLNPDGVIVGNNRCSLAGKDLNRQYRTVIRETFPSIWHTKVLIRRLQEECGVAMYIDLHAHSRRHNVFIYGCESRRGSEKRLHEQVFPLMLHKNSAEKFSFESCKFRIQRSKEGTGRVVVWMMGVANSYTMEATFAGSELGSRMCTHFSCQDFENMGKTFCETLLDFYDDDLSKEKLRNKIITRLMKEGSNADEPTNIELSDYSSDEGDTSTSSSEAEASQCEPEVILEYPAPPPSPVIQAVLRFDEKPKKRRPKLQKVKTITRYRQTLSVNRGTIDFTSDAVTDCSTENESADNTSPTRGLKKHLQSAVKRKPRRRKRMPPELKVVQAQINLDDTNIKDLCDLHKNRSKSVSVINNVTNWRPFKCFPPPKHLAEIKNFNYSPPLHLLKMSSLKANVWSGTTKDTNEPLSWGVTSSFKLKNYTDSEALLRSCSKKLADLEDEKITAMVRKSKHKNKNPLKQSSNVKEEDSDHCLDNKFKKSWKKKNRKKVSYSEFDNLNDNSKTLGQVMKQLPKDIHGGIRPLKKNSSCVGGIRNKTFAATRGNFSLSNYSEISDSELSSEAASSKKKSIKIKITNNKSIKELKKNVPI